MQQLPANPVPKYKTNLTQTTEHCNIILFVSLFKGTGNNTNAYCIYFAGPDPDPPLPPSGSGSRE